VDQQAAATLCTTTPKRSLELAVQDDGNQNNWGRMIYSGPGAKIDPYVNPTDAWNSLFSGIVSSPTPGSAASAQLLASRKSVLDFVQADIAALNTRLGAADQQKLDAHLTAIRDLESRLSAPVAAGCTPPAAPTGWDTTNVLLDDNYPTITNQMLDIMVQALSCDITRVASLQWTFSRSITVANWLGISEYHHGLSHNTDAASQADLVTLNTWYAQQIKGLMDRLAAIPEGTGTMLDHTLIFWGNELGLGNTHSLDRVPFLIAGGTNGAFRMGRYLTFNGQPHNNLLVSILNACGDSSTTFGNPAYCMGPLSGLT
jgi:hypothetical protein